MWCSKNRFNLYLVTKKCYIRCVIFCTSKSLIDFNGNVAGLRFVSSNTQRRRLMAEGGPVQNREKDKTLSPPTHQSSEEKAIEAIRHTSKYVKLNIGGSLYYTTLDTLTKQDNMLRAMFSGRLDVKTDEDGRLIS